MLPLTMTRRIGSACDADQISLAVGAARAVGVQRPGRVRRRRGRQVHVDGEVRQRPPEVVVGVAVPGPGGAQVVEHLDGAVDDRVLGHRAKASDLGVVADLEHERVGRRPVGPGLEEDGVPLAVELAADRDLLVGDLVQVSLDRRLAHRVAEHADVWAEGRDGVRAQAYAGPPPLAKRPTAAPAAWPPRPP